MVILPGLILFYGGFARGKNILSTLMHSFIIAALITVQRALWGYSPAFGSDVGGTAGIPAWFGFNAGSARAT